VGEAARELGISSDAVRKRIRRGSLPSDTRDGRRVAWLDDGAAAAGREPPVEGSEELVEQLRSEVAYLREENRRKDHMIAGLISRMPELESRGGGEDVRERDAAGGGGFAPGGEDEEPENAGERRSWWRRWFGS
jgi:hypothetical protein